MFVVSRVRELVRSAASLVSTTEWDHKEAGQGAPSGPPRSPGSTCPHGVLLPVPSFQVGSTHWQPATTVLQTDSARVQLVDRDALLQWPVLPTAAGTNFVGAEDVPLSLYDQGRQVRGVKGSMGIGIKVTAPRFVHRRDVVAPSGARVLTFVIVARTRGGAEEAIDACRVRGIGEERGYGVLQDGQTLLLYDIARSTAWFANSAAATANWYADKAVVNLELRICRSPPHQWTAWFASTTPLRLGDPLFAPYGSGSSHFHEIRADAARRAENEPVSSQRKRSRAEQLAQARLRRR